MAGDLDAALSRRHLTTLKRAYLKLRYLVDAGCVLVGHGLKTDLRMLNIAVPPAQVTRRFRARARASVAALCRCWELQHRPAMPLETKPQPCSSQAGCGC